MTPGCKGTSIQGVDFQRTLVTAAEEAMPEAGHFDSTDEIRAFVADVVASPWWVERNGPERVRVDFTSPKLRPRRAYGGSTPQRGWYVRFPGFTHPTTEHPWSVCHELAHVLVLANGGGVDHGPDFCSRYLDLVAVFVGGAAARDLADAFDAYGVEVAAAPRAA